MLHHQLRPLVLALATTLAAAADLAVVTGTTVVHDLVQRIGGERIAATCLVPAGVDPHTYRPTPADARRLADARLIVVNGLGFEGWFGGLLAESRSPATVVEAAQGVEPLALEEHGGEGHDHDHGDGDVDPHAWHDVANARRYAANIRDGLVAADPAGAAGHRSRAEALDRELAELDAWVRAQVATLPAARRVLVTNHDALGYFCRAYGFEVHAPLTAFEDAEPDARTIAGLVEFIRREGVPAVFIEHAKNPKLVERIAAEAGVRLGGALHLDGLPDPATGLTSYAAVVRHNVGTIVAALR